MNSEFKYVNYMVLDKVSTSLYQCVDKGYLYSVVVTPSKKLDKVETLEKLNLKTIVHAVYKGADNITKHIR